MSIKIKILIGIIVIALIGAGVFVITKNMNEDVEKDDETSSSMEEDKKVENKKEDKKEDKNDKEEKADDKKKGEKIDIEKFICAFKDGIAVVKANNEYYVIDEKANIIGNLTDKIKNAVNNGDSIAIVKSHIYVRGESIYNKYGERLDLDGRNFSSHSLSESGYLVAYKYEQGFEKSTTTYYLMDLNGKTIFSSNENPLNHWAGDVYYYTENEEEHYIDAKTGEETQLVEYERYGDIIYKKTRWGSDTELAGFNAAITILNDNYYFDKGEKGAFSEERDAGIYDKNGNLVKEIGESGVQYIIYYDNVYYVYSETGYLYTMDENFNYIAEPTQIHLGGYGHSMCLTSKGVLIMKDGKNVSIIDKNLNEIYKIPDNVLEIKYNFHPMDNRLLAYYKTTKYMYLDDGSYYDIEKDKLYDCVYKK